ncbi:MAG: DUF1048 domain-containing protein, partial [Eubacterium sp.]
KPILAKMELYFIKNHLLKGERLMSDFFNDYFNIKRMIEEKRAYKQQMARVEAMPEDYKFVFKKIQSYMWLFATGAGYDMMEVHTDLVELFESGIANNKKVLEITGDDVATFSEELLLNCKTYTETCHEKLNREIHEKIEKK